VTIDPGAVWLSEYTNSRMVRVVERRWARRPRSATSSRSRSPPPTTTSSSRAG